MLNAQWVSGDKKKIKQLNRMEFVLFLFLISFVSFADVSTIWTIVLNNRIYIIYIYIYIMITSRHQHRYPWPSLATLPYRQLPPAGFWVTSRIGTELLYVGSCWSSCLCSSMWRGSLEYITYELVPTSLAVSRMSGSSNFDSFRDGC